MVAPTISALSPDYGHLTGNFLMEVQGSDFTLPTSPFDFSGGPVDANNAPWPTPDLVPTTNVTVLVPKASVRRVDLTFYGLVPAEETVSAVDYYLYPIPSDVLSTKELVFYFPRLPFMPPPGRDRTQFHTALIRIENPDGALDTPLELYVPRKGKQTSGVNHWSIHAAVTQTLIYELRLGVEPNTVQLPNKFFELNGVKELLLQGGQYPEGRSNIDLPMLNIVGPAVRKASLGYTEQKLVRIENVTLDDGSGPAVEKTQVEFTRSPRRDFTYDFFVYSKSKREVMHILSALENWFANTHQLRYPLFQAVAAGSETPQSFTRSHIDWIRFPEVDPSPAHLGGSLIQGRAVLCIKGVPVGLYSNPAMSAQRRNYVVDPTQRDILHQNGVIDSDGNVVPNNPARKLDVGNP